VSFFRLVIVKIAFYVGAKLVVLWLVHCVCPFAIDPFPLVSIVSLMFYVSGYVLCFA